MTYRVNCPVCNRKIAKCGNWHCPRCGLAGPPTECEHCLRELRGERLPLTDYDFVMKVAEGMEEINRHRRTALLAAETIRARQEALAPEPPDPEPFEERTHGIRATYTSGCRCEPCTLANREYGAKQYRNKKVTTS